MSEGSGHNEGDQGKSSPPTFGADGMPLNLPLGRLKLTAPQQLQPTQPPPVAFEKQVTGLLRQGVPIPEQPTRVLPVVAAPTGRPPQK